MRLAELKALAEARSSGNHVRNQWEHGRGSMETAGSTRNGAADQNIRPSWAEVEAEAGEDWSQ